MPLCVPSPRAGSDELLEQLAAEQLAALATAAFDGPAGFDHSGGSTTAGQAAGALQFMQLGDGLVPQPPQTQPGQPEQSPQQQLDAFRAALAAAAADRQGGGAGPAGEAAAGKGAAPPAGGPSWVAEAAAGASVGLGRIDLHTSVMLMQQAAQVIRGLHEELQRSKSQVRRRQGWLECARGAQLRTMTWRAHGTRHSLSRS